MAGRQMYTKASRRTDDEQASMLLDAFESPHHNQTIRSSAKIAAIRLAGRATAQNNSSNHSINIVNTRRRMRSSEIPSTISNGGIKSSSSSNNFIDHCAHFNDNMVQDNCNYTPLKHAGTQASDTHHCQLKSNSTSSNQPRLRLPLLHVTPAFLVTLLLVVQTTLASATSPSSGTSVGTIAASSGFINNSEANAEALISGVDNKAANDNSNQNVILIKYANVTKTKNEQQGDEQLADRLNVYRLYNEPLSVPVIESKFSHSIQLFDVSHNQLSTLSKDLFCPLSNEVRQLNISHNLLENFDCLGLISQAGQLCLSELRILDMSYNLVKHLPATGVATLHNLEVLNLSHNLIESLDELSLSALFKLTRLDLSFNRIQQLPGRIFHKSTSMQVLRLQSNSLQNNINQAFLSGLISMEELNLSYNNISHVSESAFLDKPNLTRVDLSHNQLNGLRQEALRVTVLARGASVNPSSSLSQLSSPSQPIFKPRLHHNGQYAGLTQVLTTAPSRQHAPVVTPFVTEFYLSSNPFVCDCQLDWMRKFQPTIKNPRTVLSSTSSANRFQHHQYHQQNRPIDVDSSLYSSSLYQNDQPLSVIQQQQSALSAADPTATSNNISENVQSSQQQQSSQASSSSSPTLTSYGRIADLDLIKCSPLFKRNAQLKNHQRYHSRSLAPPDGAHHNLAVQVHHANNHLHHHQSNSHSHSHQKSTSSLDNSIVPGSGNMIDLLTADSSNFLCRYKSHCFALCHCCEFDACDCEMICPSGCNCYYDSSWQTNIIDCSSNNHTVVPDRIPMDVSGLYLDGNNIDSLKPSNLIARKSLRTLYLNASNLQYIANRTFNGLIELQTLYLNDNMLRSLNGYEFEPLAQLRALYLQSNRLDHINNQTFIYLRSLEILDLSNNRLTSMNLDLFMSIGHHNIRLRQLTIAHNWWSCQCSLINSFRQILKQKFLVNGGVNIADRNQLRCYYNSTTVGPLILDGSASSIQQPIYGSFLPSSGYQQQQLQPNNRQQQLTEINQCSDMIEERPYDTDVNPPIIHPPIMADFPMQFQNVMPPNDSPDNNMNQQQQQQNHQANPNQIQVQSQNQMPNTYNAPPYDSPGPINMNPVIPFGIPGNEYNLNGIPPNVGGSGSASVPLTSFVFVSVLFVCVFVVAISVFIFVRQQQRYHNHHHKKSSAASTISVSSSASSTAISTAHHHAQNNHGTSKFPYRDHQQQHHHHLSQPLNYGQHHTLHHNHQHHLIMGTNVHNAAQLAASQAMPQAHHQHTASSQSNIYAALVSPTTGSSTIVTTNHANHQHQNSNPNNLYSNSSTTASHHSSASSSQHINGHGGGVNGPSYPSATTNRLQHPQGLYGAQQQQQQQQQQLYGLIDTESPYAINASIGPYKTGTSLHNGLPPSLPESNRQEGLVSQSDWIKLPKVKQFMSKLVNKSLALSGYRSSNSRDELAAATSDKIYDAFLSYDKRDEPFVMQHLSAELEYGQPQYRVADRYRDLPLPTSVYIAEAITSVIGCSHRTIIVLSENYLTSDWCRYELQAALREIAIDKSHKIIAVVLDPRCLLDMDPEMHSLLASSATQIYTSGTAGNPLANSSASQQTQQLVQLSDGSSSPSGDFLAQQQQQQQQQQLVTTLMNQSNGNQQVCTQTALASATAAGPNKITFINYNERKFWARLKQLMPVARPSTQTLTLTTKN